MTALGDGTKGAGWRPALSAVPGDVSLRMPAVALRNRGGALELWLAEGKMYRGTVASGAVQRLQPVETGLGEILDVAPAAEATLFLVVQSISGGARGSEIVRLVARSPALIH